MIQVRCPRLQTAKESTIASFSVMQLASGVSSNLYLELPEPFVIIGSGIAASSGGAGTCVAE